MTINISKDKLARSFDEVRDVTSIPDHYDVYNEAVNFAHALREHNQMSGKDAEWWAAWRSGRNVAHAMIALAREVGGPELAEYFRRMAEHIASD
jgi:hypothetical protein